MFISNPYLPYGVAAPRATTNTLVKSDTPLTIGQLKDALTRDLAEFVAKMDTAFPRGERRLDAKPSIVLFTNQADFFAAGGVIGASAFVRADKPGKIFICLTEARKNAKELQVTELQFLKSTVSHELGHLYSMKFAQKIQANQSAPFAETMIFEDPRSAKSSSVSVKEFLLEFSGDFIAKNFLGKNIFLDRYQTINAVGARLIEKVGKAVFLKAILGNDPAAYQSLVLAAVDLAKSQKVDFVKKELSYLQKDLDKSVKAAQSTKLSGKAFEEVILERYFAEVRLSNFLEVFAPDSKSRYDLSFSNAVGKALIDGDVEISSTSLKGNQIILREWANRTPKVN